MSLITSRGLPLLFAAVAIESFGVPIPGETALIAFGVLASQGHYPIAAVIAVAAAGAIIGDNLGYWVIGREAGPALFRRWRWLGSRVDRALTRAERTIARYGGRAMFLGRFVAVLRYTVAWVAGLAHMPWGVPLLECRRRDRLGGPRRPRCLLRRPRSGQRDHALRPVRVRRRRRGDRPRLGRRPDAPAAHRRNL